MRRIIFSRVIAIFVALLLLPQISEPPMVLGREAIGSNTFEASFSRRRFTQSSISMTASHQITVEIQDEYINKVSNETMESTCPWVELYNAKVHQQKGKSAGHFLLTQPIGLPHLHQGLFL